MRELQQQVVHRDVPRRQGHKRQRVSEAGDRAAWRDQRSRAGPGELGDDDDEDNDREGGEAAVEVQAVEVEAWSDDDADGEEEATWVDAQLME